MTWDEIRAAYPHQRVFVSAVAEHFDGEHVLDRDLLEDVHSTDFVAADTDNVPYAMRARQA